ncbi:MAG TPA: hypothetical protein ENH99_02440 [Candidatus Pacearchaeota archaeon]|nr:hypothetical protein [Candidatus Pacearchaeota archaeon]
MKTETWCKIALVLVLAGGILIIPHDSSEKEIDLQLLNYTYNHTKCVFSYENNSEKVIVVCNLLMRKSCLEIKHFDELDLNCEVLE